MATLSTTNLTLADLANRQDPDGKIAKIIELLGATNEVLDDMPWLECNDGMGHRTTVRSGLPAGTWRLLNYGVQPEKSTTVQVRDATGMLESYAEVDKKLVDISTDPAGVRFSEDRAFIEGMNQTFATTLFYGDSGTNPERFTGLAPRYNLKSAENGANILDAGGAGSTNTSIWLVCWDESILHGLYPKGTSAGLITEDLGQQTLSDAGGGKYEGYRTHYQWDCGLTLRDWRYVVRIANIDVTALTKNAATGADLLDWMVQAIEMLPNTRMGRAVFYANRTIRSFLRRQMMNKSNVWLSMEEVAGKKVLAFDQIPVKRVDALLNTEARVV